MALTPKQKKISITAVVVAAGVGVGLYLWLSGPKIPKEFGYGNGRVEATTVEILSKFSARIEEINAREGDMVKKGQVLVRLDKKDLLAQVRSAEADVDQQKQAKKSAKAMVTQRKSELLLSKQNLARSKSLYVTKDISLKELQENETAVATAEATLAAAEADLVKSDASIQSAIAKADSIKVNLNECELIAPLDGRVLYRSREPGEVVNAESSILTVLDLTDVYMQFYLRTEQAGLVAVGAEARIVLDALPNRPIPAKVTFVEPRSQFTPKQVETQSERDKLMFRIKVNVDPEFLQRYVEQVKTGLPGMAYVRLDKNAPWPAQLVLPAVDEPRPNTP